MINNERCEKRRNKESERKGEGEEGREGGRGGGEEERERETVARQSVHDPRRRSRFSLICAQTIPQPVPSPARRVFGFAPGGHHGYVVPALRGPRQQ